MRLSTDVIVGFPGETEEDFKQTRSAFRQGGFEMGFIFKYSERSGTPAAELADKIPRETKERRNQELLTLLDAQSLSSNRGLVRKHVEVLVEGASRKGEGKLMGRTKCYRKVIFEGTPDLIGSLVEIRVESAASTTLHGIRT